MKLSLDAAYYEKHMKANMYKPSEKNEYNRVDNHKHWPASIKNRIQWFPFPTIIEHTAKKCKKIRGLYHHY